MKFFILISSLFVATVLQPTGALPIPTAVSHGIVNHVTRLDHLRLTLSFHLSACDNGGDTGIGGCSGVVFARKGVVPGSRLAEDAAHHGPLLSHGGQVCLQAAFLQHFSVTMMMYTCNEE